MNYGSYATLIALTATLFKARSTTSKPTAIV